MKLIFAIAVLLLLPAAAQAVPLNGRTFDQAYDQAQPGDTIEVPAGTYGSQTITGTKSGRVTLAATGAVTINGFIDVNADNVTLRGMTITGGLDSWTSGTDRQVGVKLEQVKAKSMGIQNVTDFTVSDGDLGPNPGQKVVTIGANPESFNVVFERTRFHDNPPTDGTQHMECIFVTGIQGLTVRDSIFERCGYFGILTGMCCTAPRQPRDIVLERNKFGQTYRWDGGAKLTAPYSLSLGGGRLEGTTRIVGNQFDTPPAVQPDVVFNNLVASCNTGAAPTAWKTCAPPPPPPPPPDRDGDGFPDGSDLCPDVAGQAPDGCPPIIPPPPTYSPLCKPTCDEQIAAQSAEIATLRDRIARMVAIGQE